MKSIYEFNRELTGIHITEPENEFFSHFHNNVEIYLIDNGKYQMTLNDKSFVVGNGDIVIADSYDVHSYKRVQENKNEDSRIIIIPYEYLLYFNRIKGERKIKMPLISDKSLCTLLIKFIDEHIAIAKTEDARKLSIDYLFSLLLQKLEFEKEKGIDNAKVIKQILSFIHNNFKDDASRKTIAKNLGYSQEHISRVFHKFMKTSISNYVNNLRLDYVQNNKSNSDKSLIELIYEAGFNNQRTFYRIKKKASQV